MTRSAFRGIVGFAIAGSMLASSSGAVAATYSAPAPQYNPWAVLTVMSGGAPAAAMCGAAAVAAAAQGAGPGCVLPKVDATPVAANPPPSPIPVPPVEGPGAGLGISPLLLALGALAVGAALYFALRHHHGNSPH
jgi:hypothetical protein